MNFQKLKIYYHLMRLDKPIGIYLLLWPTLMALWIAGNGKPNPFIVMIFILGVIVMRSAGCVINDIADQNFDKSVTRTKNRPLAANLVSVKEAVILCMLLIGIAFILVLQLNILTIFMSVVALLLAASYPFMKRFTHLPQFILGAAFGFAVPMAFAALSNAIPTDALLLYLAAICWAVAYDTEYAMVDREDDLSIGLKSTAILFGRFDKIMIAIFHVLTLIFLAKLGYDLQLGKFYYCALVIGGSLVIYQQYLLKDRISQNCFKAFQNNHYFGLIILLGVMLAYL